MGEDATLAKDGQEEFLPAVIEPMPENTDSEGSYDTPSDGTEPEEDAGPIPQVPGTKEDLRAKILGTRRIPETPVEEKRFWMFENILNFLESKGARMSFSSPIDPMLSFDGMTHHVSITDPTFSAFLQDIARINSCSPEGKAIIQLIRNHIILKGQPVEVVYGHKAFPATDTIYVHLNTDREEILRISPRRCSVIRSGEMPERVALFRSDAEPIRFIPNVDVRESLGLLKGLILDNLACSDGDAYFIVGWVLATFLRDYARNRTILKLSGASDSGKSTAAKLITTLLTGRLDLEASRIVKDLFIRGAVSQVLPLENIEARDITPTLLRFLLCAATGVVLTRRKLYSDSGRVVDRLNSYVCVTSIEPFRIMELVNRTFDVEMDKRFFSDKAFDEMGTLQKIVDSRDVILSGVFRLLAEEILPSLAGARTEIMRYLGERHKGHFTQRCDETTALALIWARILQKFCEGEDRSEGLLDYWITSQDRKGRQTVQETSPLISLFSIIHSEYEALHPEEFRERYHLWIQKSRDEKGVETVWFECATRDLLRAILTVNRKYGLKTPYNDAGTLAARLRSEQSALAKIGWRIEWGVKMVRGTKFHRFSVIGSPATD